MLAAEWPPRSEVTDPDPFAVVSFASDHPALALCQNGKDLVVVHRLHENGGFRCAITGRRFGGGPLMAAAPLVSGTLTAGVLGAVKCRGRKWKPEALHTLETVASLFAQFQARVLAEHRLRHLAEHDDLTGLPNRRALLAHLSERLAGQQPGPVTVLYIDLDRLKAINDCLGHAAGDWFIKDFANRLLACAGSQSIVARLGGDEFVVVPDQPMSAHAAESFADRIRTMVHDRLTIDDQTITRTVSIGLADGMPGRDQAPNSCVVPMKPSWSQSAQAATGSRWLATIFFEATFPQRHRTTPAGRHRQRRAAAALSARGRPVDGCHRGRRGAGPLAAPGAGGAATGFVHRGGRIDEPRGDLDRWVLRTACAEFSGWRSRGVGREASLRVNVSPLQLTTPGFVRMVADTIDEFGMDDGSLCLEITERAAVHDVDSTARTLTQLKDVGVQTSIDDFGTGYAVLSHLKRLPVDALKIDPRFVPTWATTPTSWRLSARSSALPTHSTFSWSLRVSRPRPPHWR